MTQYCATHLQHSPALQVQWYLYKQNKREIHMTNEKRQCCLESNTTAQSYNTACIILVTNELVYTQYSHLYYSLVAPHQVVILEGLVEEK